MNVTFIHFNFFLIIIPDKRMKPLVFVVVKMRMLRIWQKIKTNTLLYIILQTIVKNQSKPIALLFSF